MATPITPKILWGTSLANTWTFNGPGDKPLVLGNPLAGFGDARSGLRDAWVEREDHELTITARLIPQLTTASATGYSSPNGVYAALLWMNELTGNFRFYGDKGGTVFHDCVLVEPAKAERDDGGVFWRVTLHFRDVNGVAFTDTY